MLYGKELKFPYKFKGEGDGVMNLRVLRYFLTVAKEQSFTKAAEQLNLTQPTLSRQLAALEEELGAKLFDRGGRVLHSRVRACCLKGGHWKSLRWKIRS